MGTYSDTDRTATRVPRTDEEIREARNQDARVVVAGRALKRPDTETFLLDILGYLGLDGKTDSPPSPVRLIPPDEVKGPGSRPKDADTYEAPEPVDPEHVPGGSYKRGCRCTPCREKHNAYQSDYMKRRRVAAQTDGRPMPPSTTTAAQNRRAEARAKRAAYLAAFQADALGDTGGQP